MHAYCLPLTVPPPWLPARPPVPLHAAGCIFHYDDDKFKQGNGVGFKESDTPNFTGSYYSYTKAMVESLLKVRRPLGWLAGCAGWLGAWEGAGLGGWWVGGRGVLRHAGGSRAASAGHGLPSLAYPACITAPVRCRLPACLGAGVPQRADPARAHAHRG